MVEHDAQNVPIRFLGYKIENLQYGVDVKQENRDFQVRFGITEDKKHALVRIKVNFYDKGKKTLGVLEVSGHFELKEKISDNNRKLLIGRNGTAMLYPYVRSIISMVTSLDNNNVAVLPTLNFVELFGLENND